jgi:uncharacterized protein
MSTEPVVPAALSAHGPVAEDRSSVAPVWHTVVFVVVTLGLTGLQAQQTPKVSTMNIPTRLPVYLVMIVFALILLSYVWLLGLRPAGKTLRDIIGGRWNHPRDFWLDVGIALAFWMVVAGMLVAMRGLLGQNKEGLQAMRMLIPRTYAEMVVWVVLSVTAGFCEELIFRGYLQRQFLALTGNPAFAVVLQAIVFGVAHLYQGWKGALTITVYGGLFGALAAWRKSLRPGMIQHASQDTFSGILGSLALRHHYL